MGEGEGRKENGLVSLISRYTSAVNRLRWNPDNPKAGFLRLHSVLLAV